MAETAEASMKITAVKTAATTGHGMHLWVRIETDEGITGLGECVHGGVQAIAIIQELRRELLGRDPFADRRDLRGAAPRPTSSTAASPAR